MQFYEKLDFLMNITNTTNSALSLNIKLDASHISRLRRGKRNALKDEACINAIAEYFARRCTEDYQLRAILDAMEIERPHNCEKISAALIARWLSNEKKDDTNRVESFLTGFSNITATQKIVPSTAARRSLKKYPKAETSVYYGSEGKRQAVIYFLSEVLSQEKPQTLLLFSDEPTEWMTTDREFAAKWARLMFQLLSKGNRIKIIHTVSRDLDEMLSAISQWMPLYMSGAIEPYYYPKKRDGIFKRTLFISPGISAVVSGSVGNAAYNSANLLFRSGEAINAFEEEFYRYLSMCKPLMRIFTTPEDKTYFETLLEFEKEKSDSIVKTESLSLHTMPDAVYSSILSRTETKVMNLGVYHIRLKEAFESNLKYAAYTEIVKLFDTESVISGKVKVAFSLILGSGAVYYTPEEYILHLENLLHLLVTYEQFHICLTDNIGEDRYMMYVKEDLGTIVAKTSAPPVVLAISESNMTASFGDFLKDFIGEKAPHAQNKKESIKKLTEYIHRLKKAFD